MGKYNVGDKVRIVSERGFGWNSHGKMDKYLGAVMTVRETNVYGFDNFYKMEEDSKDNNGHGWLWHTEHIVGLVKDETPSEKIAEEKIVITHDGKVTTATLYGVFGNKETATARCAPEDTFDFSIGAALALERLTEKVTPKWKFETGDYAKVISNDKSSHGIKIGTVVKLERDEICEGKVWYKVYDDSPSGFWFVLEEELEASKYYNGKVVCVDNGNVPDDLIVGKIYNFVDGCCKNELGGQITNSPVKNFGDLQSRFLSVKFIPIVE